MLLYNVIFKTREYYSHMSLNSLSWFSYVSFNDHVYVSGGCDAEEKEDREIALEKGEKYVKPCFQTRIYKMPKLKQSQSRLS